MPTQYASFSFDQPDWFFLEYLNNAMVTAEENKLCFVKAEPV